MTIESRAFSGLWFQTGNNVKFSVLEPNVNMIELDDISNALSNQCRFNGHVSRYYSVAQHCIMVAGMLPDEISIYGLLHDAGEAYTGDIITPIKNVLGDVVRDIENDIMECVYKKFNIELPTEEVSTMVHRADSVQLLTEASQLFDYFADDWDGCFDEEPLDDALPYSEPRIDNDDYRRLFWLALGQYRMEGVGNES